MAADVSKHRQEAEKRVKIILAKVKKFNLRDKEIAHLFFTYKRPPIFNNLVLMGTLVVCGVFYAFRDRISDDFCWLEMPHMITKATRPPEEDCSFCSDVDEVQRIANLTPREFENLYAYSGIPVVVTDATINWQAMNTFEFSFFKKLYMETELGKAARDCQFFPYKTEFKNLYDALEMDTDRANLKNGTKPWYIGWSNCHDNIAKIMRLYYNKPYFLPESAENNAVDWIFMGGPGFGAQMHVDNVVHPSWQAQLKGRKRWYLAPPPECFYSCKFLHVDIHPGEIIVIDTNRWYHKTEVLQGDISITIGAEYD